MDRREFLRGGLASTSPPFVLIIKPVEVGKQSARMQSFTHGELRAHTAGTLIQAHGGSIIKVVRTRARV